MSETTSRSVIAYQAHAFSSFTHFTQAKEGSSVADMVRSLDLPEVYNGYVKVWLNDLPVEVEDWERTLPDAGQMVYIRVVPQGGGGKDILRVVLAIAIAVVAVVAAPYVVSALGLSGTVATAAVTAGLTVLGNMALNALIPPPKPDFDLSGGLGSKRNQLTGSSNRYAPYAPIPRVFGRRRVYPLLAGRPYSETQGDDEYLRMALLVGWGPLQISDIRIGDTPITSFEGVQYEVREGWSNDAALTLYSKTINESGYNILLDPPTPSQIWSTRTTSANTSEISVDITAPSGIAKFESDGKRSSINVDVQVQYSVAGANSWQTPTWLNSADTGLSVNGRIRMSGQDTSAIRRTGRFSVPAGQYDVRISRQTTQFDTTKHVQEVRWTTMRSIQPTYPVLQSGVCLIALRIKATGQLNGVPQVINCLAESYLPVYDGTENLITRSQEFDQAAWVKQSGATITANSTAAPDSTTTADTLTTNAVSLGVYNLILTGNSIAYTASIYAKAGTTTSLTFGLTNQNESSRIYYSFNLSNGTFAVNVSSGFTAVSASMVSAGNGWYRCIVTGTTPASGTTSAGLFARNATAGTTFLWGGQLELGSTAKTYFATTTAAKALWVNTITRNPAWAFTDILRRRGAETYLADDRIDLPSILSWANACSATAPNAAEPYWNFDGVVEGGSVFQVLRQIASTARANYIVRDGKHSVVRDIQQTVPVQHITPRNSFGYSGSKAFLDYPHALRVVFANSDKNYEEDERIVYDDGYTSANATKFETLELFGCTSSTQAFREGRYHIAVARLRPEEHTVQMDVENVRCTLGDLVQFQHDVISIGIASARVTALSLNGSNQITAITLDQEVPIETTKSYALRARKADGTSVLISLTSPANTNTTVVTLVAPLAAASGPEVGDLVMYGEAASVSATMLVKKIEPGPDLSAKLYLVDAQNGVYTADTGTIPAFNSNITIVQPVEETRPYQVTIQSLRSDESALLQLNDGTLQDRIAVTLDAVPSANVSIDSFEVQWRELGAAVWNAQRYVRGTPIFVSPVQAGASYELRVRALTIYGVAGDWSTTANHTVVGKLTAPIAVGGFGYTITDAGIEFYWDASTEIDYDSTIIKSGASWSTATPLFRGKATKWTWVRPATGSYTILAKHIDTVGNESTAAASLIISYTSTGISNSAITLTSAGALQGGGGGQISLGSIPGAINSTQFATGIEPVTIVAGSTLPTVKSTNTIYLQGDGKLYRWNGTQYASSSGVSAFSELAGSIASSQIPDALLTTAKFASSIEPVTIVTGALPTVKSTSTIYLTSDSKIYRWNGTAYTSASGVSAFSELTGSIATSQIPDAAVTSAKIADAALTTAKFASTIEPVTLVTSVPGTKSTNTIYNSTDGKIYRWNGSAYVATVPTGDLSGTVSSSQIADGAVIAAKIADAAVTTAKFANGIEPVEIVAALPSSGNFQGRIAFLTTDNKLYRYNGSAWVASIPTTDLTGTISTAQIADAALTTAKFATSIEPVSVVSAVPGTKSTNTIFNTTDGKLYRWNGSSYVASVPTADLSGTIGSTQIADSAVTAAKIADATLTTAKFASSIEPVSVVAAVPGTKSTNTVFNTTDGKLYRWNGSSYVASVPTADLSGTIGSTQIADSAVTAAKIADATLTTAKFASTIEPVSVVSSVPGTKSTNTVFNTTDGKLYRWNGSSYVASVPTGDLSGTIGSTQIADSAVTAAKIADATLTTAKFASTIEPVGVVTGSTLPTVKSTNTIYLTGTGKMYRWVGAAYTAVVDTSDLNGTISSAQIADSSVTAAKIADSAVTTAKFASGIEPVEIVAALPSTGNFAGRIAFLTTDNKLYRHTGSAWVASVAAADVTGTLTNSQLDSIAAAKITGSIVGTQITDGAISTAKIAAGAITSNEIAANTIVAADIASATITGTQIAGTTITASNIAASTITSSQIAADTLTAGQIAAGAISTSELASNAVTAAKIAANTITASEIAANTITASQIASATITGTQIAGTTITASNIASGTITATQIAADTITAGQIAAGAVSASELSAGSVTTSKLLVTGAGAALNDDPAVMDASAWDNAGFSFVTITDGVSGVYAARSGTSTSTIFSRNIAINPNKTYRVRAKVNPRTGNGVMYLVAGIKDSSGAIIGRDGTHWYYPVSGTAPAAGWNEYSGSFGAGQGGNAFPSNARSMYVGIYLNYNGTSGFMEVQDLRLEEYVGGDLIVDGAITTDKLSANAVTAGKIAANTITASQIASATITGTNIAASTITGTNIAADTITAGQIAAGAISTSELAANAVTAAKIAAGTITANEIASNTITASQIASATITGTQIAGATITGTQIAGDTITAGQIAAGAIGASEIAANAVTTSKLLVSGQGAALNPDPSFSDPSAWAAGQVFLTGLTDGPSGSTAITNTIGTNSQPYSHAPIPIEPNKKYRLEVWVKQYAGTGGHMYAGVIWVDAAGNTLSNISPAGWSNGSYSYMPNVSFHTPTSSWVRHTFSFGPGEAGAIPSNAKFVQLFIILNINSTAGVQHAMTGFKLMEKADADLIVDGAITTDKLSANAVTAGKIAANTITASQIAGDTITAGQIAAGAVSTSELASNAVTAAKIAAGTITANEIASNTITATQIASATITGTQIAGTTITGANIAADTIAAGQIAAGAISTSELASNAVTAAKIAAGTITANEIASSTITATQIASATITGTQIAGTTITGTNIAGDTITAGQIAAGAIGASEVAAGAIRANHILVAPKSLNLDPSFEGGLATWSGFVRRLIRSNAAVPTGCPVEYASEFNARDNMGSTYIDVVPGEVYRASCWVNRGSGSGGSGVGVVGYVLDASGSVFAAFAWPGATTTASGWNRVSGLYTIPANGARLRFGAWADRNAYTGEAWYADLTVEKAADASLIVDGAITTDKLSANAVTAAKIAAGTITATEIASSTITGTNIAGTTITGGNIAGDTITAGQIAAGAIGASEIAADAITAGKVLIRGRGPAINDDPAFTDESAWAYGGHGDTATRVAISDSVSGQYVYRSTTGASSSIDSAKWFAVSSGKKYRLSVWARRTSNANGVFYVRLLDQVSNQITSFYEGGAISTSWQRLSFEFVPTTAQREVRLRAILNWTGSAGYHEIADFRLEEKTEGDLIVDGAITAIKIAANTITSSQIASDTITAGQIAAGAISTSELAANAVTAGNIAAGAITAQKIAVSPYGMAINDDPMFADSSAWQLSANTTFATGTSAASAVGNTYLVCTNGTDQINYSAKTYPISPSKTYRLSASLYQGASGGRNMYLLVQFYDYNGAYVDGAVTGWGGSMSGYTFGGTLETNGVFMVKGAQFGAGTGLLIPASVRRVQIGVWFQYSGGPGSTNVTQAAQNLRLEEVLGGELIVDGAITAGKIAAGSITADKISVSSLSSIAANIGTLTTGLIRNAADTFRVDATNGRTIVQNGSYMKVTGIPFGSANQFIEWYGPYQANLANCTEGNATYYLKTTGAAYFGGTLSAGTLKNSGATSSLANNAEIIVGPFGTNGNTKTVTLSYAFSGSWVEYQSQNFGSGGGSISATVKLYRKIGANAETEVATLNASGTWEFEIDPEPQPGSTYIKAYSQDMSGSLTFTDSVSGTSDRTFRAIITARTLGFGTLAGLYSQRVEIVAIEQ